MRKMSLFLFGFILLIPIVKVSAHQSGCHRWHSCPSDTGSYVCGDLGYTSGCPKAVNVQKPVPVKATQIVTVVPQITKEEKCLNKSVEFGDTFLIQKGYHKNQDGSWTDKKGKYPKTRLENKMEKKQTAIYTACLALN